MANVALVPHTDEHVNALQAVQLAAAQVAGVDAQAREQGSATLLLLSAAENVVDLVCYVVEHTKDPAAVFHALGALLRRVPTLPAEHAGAHVHSLVDVREWLLHISVARAQQDAWPAYVQAQVYRAVAVLSKRAAVLLDDERPLAVLGTHTKSLLDGDATCVLVALGLTVELCENLGVDCLRAADGALPAGLTATQHAWCKTVFQVRVLGALGGAEPGHRFDAAVKASCSALKWNYGHGGDTLPTDLSAVLYSDHVPAVLAHAIRVANAAHLEMHAAMLQEALEHVAALRPTGSDNSALWCQQRVSLFKVFSDTLSADVSAAAFAAQGLRRLFSEDASVAQLAASLTVDELCAPLVQLTRSAYSAVITSADEPQAADAALDAVLNAWIALFDAAARADASAVIERMKGVARDIVVLPYLEMRLAAADVPDTSEHDSAAEDDAETYNEQLDSLAALARLSGVQEIVSAAHAAMTALGPVLSTSPTDAAWERLHWLCLVAGHVLADSASGETPAPPDCVSHALPAVQDTCVSLMQGLSVTLLGPLAERNAGSSIPTSPQALVSLLWFTARWVPSYLLREAPACPAEACLAGENGSVVLTSLVASLLTVYKAWQGDADVLDAAAGVLDSFANSRGVMKVLLVLPQMQELVQLVAGSLERLPSRSQAPILRALLCCTNAAKDVPAELRDTFYLQLAAAVRSRVQAALTARPDSPAVADILYAVLSILGALAQSADPLVSPKMHEAVLEQLPTVVHLAKTHSAHADVLLAAISATNAAVKAVAELDTPDEGAFAASKARELVEIIPSEPSDERAELVSAGLSLAASAASAPAGGTDALFAYIFLARDLSDDLLSEPNVPVALSGAVSHLFEGHSALLASFGTPQYTTASISDTAKNGSPLEAVLRAAVYIITWANERTSDEARRICEGLSTFATQINAAPAPIVDRFICELVHLVLAGDLDAVLFAPVLHSLRALLVSRAAAQNLGGMQTLSQSLQAAFGGDASLQQAVQHTTETLLMSISSGVPSGGHRSADAKAAAAAVEALLPFIASTRGALRVR
ncbi:hypothetical protein MCUN1_003101 [Malassezia cuniculi]|uniref:Uncharacterized protein n=1 Tax=Malassezia cuniculi TaxID=948313 RepID=A0AAF0J7G0_9BASI|nr:hypothetical protein MCUN1_003101 [Malassezia cuniculi]